MGRWQPGTRERLQGVALELFGRQGYEATTVADIAARADVTERTFYRYFADKREVLFDGRERLVQAFLDGVATAPSGATPMELTTAGLEGAADFFPEDRRAWSRARQATIDSDPALQERELLKLAALSSTAAAALRERGVPEPEASLSADAAIAVFRSTFTRWIADDQNRSFAELQRETLATLRTLAGPGR